MSARPSGGLARRVAVPGLLLVASLPGADAHDGGATAYAHITLSGQTVRYSLSIPDLATRPLAPALREADAGTGRHDALAGAVRESIRLAGDATACAPGPARVGSGSELSVSMTITIDFACPSTMRNLLIRNDAFDVLGNDLHILARIEHDGVTDSFAFATENRQVAVGVGSRRDPVRGVASFFALGIEHILTGYDHLLFLFALMIGGGSAWSLVRIVTAFTLAHSMTLTAAALDLIVVPGRIVESAIALSIAYVAAENLFIGERGTSKRWLVALAFGLVHGFGFSAVLKDLGLPQDGLAWSLLLFNLGVEAGQALVIVAAIPLLVSLNRASWRPRAVRVMSWGVLGIGLLLFAQRAFFP